MNSLNDLPVQEPLSSGPSLARRRGFIGLAACLLLVRPAIVLSGVPVLPIPGWYEQALVPFLFGTALLITASRQVLGAIILSMGLLFFLGQSVPLTPAARLLLFWFAIEWLAPETRPFIRATAILLIPATSSSLLGEPLSPLLLAPLVMVSLKTAWHSMLLKPSAEDPAPDQTLTPKPERDALLGLLLGIVFAIVPSGVPSALPNEHRPIVFDESHGSLESSRREAPRRNGHQTFFSAIPGATHLETPLSQGIPRNAVLVSILPTIAYTPDEIALLYQHVRAGGGFLAILDHSDMAGASSRLAPLLSKFGILPESDSIPWPGFSSVGAGFSQALGPVRGRPGTGATLSAPRFWWPWYVSSVGPHPLVWLEDASQAVRASHGDPGKAGLKWLGAWGRSGQGTWMVLTDSSWFQNGQLSQNVRFAQGVFNLLQSPPAPFPYPVLVFLIILLLPFAAWRFVRSRRGHPVLILFLFLGSAIGSTWNAAVPRGVTIFPDTRPIVNLVLGNSSRSALTADRPSTFSDNLDTFCEEIGNAGWGLETHSGSAIPGNAPVWVIPPQDGLPSRAVRQRIHEQVEQGSALLLIGDPENPESADLFAEFGFSITMGSPEIEDCVGNSLGLPDRLASRPERIIPTGAPFLASWTTLLWSDYPNRITGGEPLFVTETGKVVMAVRQIRQGKVIAVADPVFFANRALEIPGRLDDPDKRRFIRHLLHLLNPGGRP